MVLQIARRELLAYLHSPFSYVVSAAFLFINGFFFAAIVGSFSSYSTEAAMYGQSTSIMTDVVQPFLETVGLLLVLFAPLLTMRVLAEEQRSGSINLLLSSPVSSMEIVLGKFLGMLGFWAVLFGIGMGYVPLFLSWASEAPIQPLLVALLGLMLLAAAASALGLAASSLSGSQMLAAVVTWAGLLFLWIAGFLADFDGLLGSIGSTLGMLVHFNEFAKGLIQSSDLIYFGALTAFFLFCAQQRVESHRWR